jgi:hypothetical protein
MKWLHKLSQPGQPWWLGVEALLYGLVGVVLAIAYFVSHLRAN